MRTKNFLKHLILGALILTTGKVVGQSTTPGNVASGPTDFLGWDATSPANDFPLEVRHDGNFPIEWYTDALQRMHLNPSQNSTINTFTVPTDGFLGLGTFPVTGTAPGLPWTRLHLHDALSGAGFVDFGFRDWMRNGMTITGHGDQMYVGHKYGAGLTDPTDAIFQWSDNSSNQQGPDLMRFIFTGDFLGTATGENSLFGREIMQLHPRGFVGIGDWNAAAVSPTAELDVLNGQIRFRDLPTGPASTLATQMVVVRPDGVLEHMPIPTGTGSGADCDWTLLGGAGTNANIATAYALNPGCPQADRMAGIGTSSPGYKVDVQHSATDASLSGGMRVKYLGNSAGFTYGINTVVEPVAGSSMGTVTGI
ncbi:MAG: hypothetical protein WAR83_09055 [Flavobacteriales bacterium]